jgi:hypothetical protein
MHGKTTIKKKVMLVLVLCGYETLVVYLMEEK